MSLIRYTLLLSLILSGTSLFSQPASPVHSGNYLSVAQEISDLFGSTIQVSSADIAAFFAGLIVQEDLNCPYPEAGLDTYDDHSVTFTWTAPAGTNKFLIHQLHLWDGSSDSSLFYPSPSNKYKLGNLPDGLYLFAFQSICGNNRSAFGIIIADKDVMFQFDPTMSCKCTKLGNVNPLAGNQSPFALGPNQNMQFVLNNTALNLEPIVMRVVTGGLDDNNQFMVFMNPGCGNEDLIATDFNVIYPEFGSEAAFYTLDGNLYYSLGPNLALTQNYCKSGTPNQATPGKSPEGEAVAAFSFQHQAEARQLVLGLPASVSTGGLLRIFDLNGRLLQQHPIDAALPVQTFRLPDQSGMLIAQFQFGNLLFTRKLIQ